MARINAGRENARGHGEGRFARCDPREGKKGGWMCGEGQVHAGAWECGCVAMRRARR